MVEPNEPISTEEPGIDFRDRDLRGRDFSEQNLQNADFAGADLRGCSSWGSDLSGANFQAARLGSNQEQIHALLLAGFISALGYLLLFGILMEILNLLEGNSHDTTSTSADLPNLGKCNGEAHKPDIWMILKRSGVTQCLLVTIPLGLVTIFMIGIQLLGYVNHDSIIEANVITICALATTIFCGYSAIFNADETLTTNFSNANLEDSRFDRTAFQNTISKGATIDNIRWL